MKLFRRTLLLWFLVLVLPGRPVAEELVIGMSAAFTGPSGGLGIELYRGAMAYVEQINRNGGVHGKRIAIKAYDDGYNPIPAIHNTIKLIDIDRVFLLFGYVGTPTVTRILPLLKTYGDQSVYLLFPFTGAQPLRQPPYDAYVFNLRASYQEETAGLVDHFVAVGRTRLEEPGWGYSIKPMPMAEAAGKASEKRSPNMMASESLPKPRIVGEPVFRNASTCRSRSSGGPAPMPSSQ
jgi:hypothetical protein